MKFFVLSFLLVSLNLMIGDQLDPSASTDKDNSCDDPSQVNWNSWSDYAALEGEIEKKVILKVYTNWCTWCRRMERQTFNDPTISSFLNENFYPVAFDAETRDELEYKGKTYKFVDEGMRGHHELAATLLQGRMSFPTVVFLDEEGEYIQSIVGFKTAEEFEMILVYFHDNYYKTKPWSAFKRDYQTRLTAKD